MVEVLVRLAALIFACLISLASFADDAETFAGRVWSLDVPSGYDQRRSAQPAERTMTTAFTTLPREDGTRPLIQVTLADLGEVDGGDEILEVSAKNMIDGIGRRREQFKVERTETEIRGKKTIRYAWSGVSIPATDGAPVRAAMHGVMLVRIDAGMIVVLHTQDVDAFAGETLVPNETALRTFQIRRK